MVAGHVIVGLFSGIFTLIYPTSSPKMVYDMFKTVIGFISKVNMQTSLRFKGWGKTPPCVDILPQIRSKQLIFFLIKN